jgi:hypothetical protein
MMIESLLLLGGLLRSVFWSRADLVAENLLFRPQLTVLSRPPEGGPGPALATNYSGS